MPTRPAPTPSTRSAYLCCPAYPLADAAHYQRTLVASRAFAERAGLNLVISPLLTRHPGVGTWLDSTERIADFTRALTHDVMFAARGGYGCLDLLDAFPVSRPQRNTTLIGFSDVTVLHAAWYARGWGETVYGFMPGVPAGQRALESALSMLAGQSMTLDAVSDPTVQIVRPGIANGQCFAACLRVLAGLVGTPDMPTLAGGILAIEDIDERPYRIDRDLNQLWRAGRLAGVAGLVGGVFPAGLPAGYCGPRAIDVLRIWGERLDIPVIAGLPFGHHADPVALPCGRDAHLACTNKGSWTLTFAER